MEELQDVFISHSSKDKAEYVIPLVDALSARGITYWLDIIEVAWGDSIVGKINGGLKRSRRILLCLSKNFLEKRWPLFEMEAALARQNDTGARCILPLILNSKEEILAEYPLLYSLSYRLFDSGVESIAAELAAISSSTPATKNGIRIRVESAHSGRLYDIIESPRVSVDWLVSKARTALGGKDKVDIGAFKPLTVQWILVDVNAEDYWSRLTESEQRDLRTVVKIGDEVKTTNVGTTSLEVLGVPNGTVFHLYGITVDCTIALKDPRH